MKDGRKPSEKEMKKRGCVDCADLLGHIHCKFTKCPYHELDNVRTYGEYLKKN